MLLTDEEIHQWLLKRLGKEYRFNIDFCRSLAKEQLKSVIRWIKSKELSILKIENGTPYFEPFEDSVEWKGLLKETESEE